MSIQEFRGFSLSGDQKYPKSFIFLPLGLACVVMLVNNLLSSLLNFFLLDF